MSISKIVKAVSKPKDLFQTGINKLQDIKGVVGKAYDLTNTAMAFKDDPFSAVRGHIPSDLNSLISGGGFGGGIGGKSMDMLSNLGFGDPLGDFIGGLGGESAAMGGGVESVYDDMRLRLTPMNMDMVIGGGDGSSNILSILRETNGMLFPYTPHIEWNQAVNYSSTPLSHTNQDFHIYKSTPSTQLSISGKFTVQNKREAEYLLAVMHFLRTVSKMHFGKNDPNAGLPPPVLSLSGYGEYMFNELPVIVLNHGYTLPEDAHYVDVMLSGGTARIPVICTINIQVVVQNTPKRLREEFNLEEFRTGQLLKNKGWI